MEVRPEAGDASPAKKMKREVLGVEMILKQTAEIGMVLVGMAALRDGAPPTSLERHLAIKAYSNLEGLVECVAPNDLVSKKSLQSLIQQFSSPQDSTLRPVSLPIPAQDVSTPASVTLPAPASTKAASTSGKKSSTTSITATLKPADKLGASKTPMTPLKDFSNVSIVAVEDRVEKGPPALVFKTPSKDSSNVSIIAMEKSVEKVPTGLVFKTPISPLRDSPNVSITAMEEKVEKGRTALVSKTAVSSLRDSSNVSITAMEEKVEKGPTALVFTTPISPSKDSSNVSITAMKEKVEEGPTAPEAEIVERAREVEAVEPQVDQKKYLQEIALEVGLLESEVVTTVLPEMASAYMNSPITCGICKVLVNDSASVLICDGCETGFHLICLQAQKVLDIPGKDWYCTKCLTANGGRPRQPIYGPIRRGPGRPGSRTTWILKSACGHHSTKVS
ncbi:uncharacterized protein [Physcomitrium patens]|uniref:PHD-type domain-containing protein n=1 Tax=Physcomitrium patens TaxID=3218 RepID=A0A7I4EZ70_PHYPA|nr:uncharacterized protein LOC112287647 [Physcomitrium patens]XP_024386636.1 uncharacterized protein LOC112287647 [Physcomitrium patens]XP_024386637.1 uncharacterized protein LOC112287647 [Physcomitrium patens]XP_024386638.1 uncharacterized protein LOC112287647 [Physcomitrium patens]XP_024386639.1 uncharacterized protein LOC112287647 [Physcomitrium patens]XP_024386640.1 uncharacterized protein LOC112287647 [Physcomitrium patens]XP_024386641.1 uncharacterized protein LOC112287647 [Physcomitriu|eukprot:XP_024386635.1 uncharacterized protein LOC112287647 [Physcomitrella patens]